MKLLSSFCFLCLSLLLCTLSNAVAQPVPFYSLTCISGVSNYPCIPNQTQNITVNYDLSSLVIPNGTQHSYSVAGSGIHAGDTYYSNICAPTYIPPMYASCAAGTTTPFGLNTPPVGGQCFVYATQPDTIGWELINPNDATAGIQTTYLYGFSCRPGIPSRLTTKFLCQAGYSGPLFASASSDSDMCVNNFTFIIDSNRHACGNITVILPPVIPPQYYPSGSDGLSGGSIFLISLACVLFVYLVAGSIYNKRRGKTGCDICPNHDSWSSFFGNAKAGLSFTIFKLKSLCSRGDSSHSRALTSNAASSSHYSSLSEDLSHTTSASTGTPLIPASQSALPPLPASSSASDPYQLYSQPAPLPYVPSSIPAGSVPATSFQQALVSPALVSPLPPPGPIQPVQPTQSYHDDPFA